MKNRIILILCLMMLSSVFITTNTINPQQRNKNLNENLLNENYIGSYSISTELKNDSIIFIGTSENGLYISNNAGKKYEEIASETFRNKRIIKTQVLKNGYVVIVTKNDGIFFIDSKNLTIENRSNGLPKKMLIENDEMIPNIYRDITDFATDENSPDTYFVSTKYEIYYTKDAGKKWSFYAKLPNINCIDFSMKDGFTLYVGTSIDGLYKQSKWNGSFVKYNKSLVRTGSIIDELSSIHILTHEKGNDEVYTGFNYRNSIFKLNKSSKDYNWDKMKIPFKEEAYPDLENINSIRSISTRFVNGQKYITIVTDLGIFETDNEKQWRSIELNKIFSNMPKMENINTISIFNKDNEDILTLNHLNITPFGKEIVKKSPYFEKASNKKGLYLLTWNVEKTSFINNIEEYLDTTPMNMVVVDMKDDSGFVRYNSKNDIVKKVGSVSGKIDAKKFIEKMHKKDIYVIARLVLFKDEKLYNYQNNKYAVRDSKTDKPWAGHKYERWVDPFSEFVWDYNIAIANELVEIGFDEIQFDYARFPTDGEGVGNLKYNFQKDGMIKADALESFFRKARKLINAPISIDIYGRNGWYQINDRVGQDADMLSNYVDAICPMFYPSHFGNSFLNFKPYEQRPLRIYYYGTLRTLSLTGYKVVARPYVQAFKLSSSKYDKSYYNIDYIINEIKGCDMASPTGGYTFWNAGNKYENVKKAYDKMINGNS